MGVVTLDFCDPVDLGVVLVFHFPVFLGFEFPHGY